MSKPVQPPPMMTTSAAGRVFMIFPLEPADGGACAGV
jgi:hypothetical protein